MNVETIKRKPLCLLLRNNTRKQSRQKLKKINDSLTNMPTNNVTELNNLTYAGAKLVCGKIGIPPKKMNRESKSG